MLNDEQRRVISLLIELARTVDRALDDSEERIGDDGRFHAINGPDFDELSDALEKLEALPDDKPGETLGAGGKAEWALRSILASAAPAEGRETEQQFAEWFAANYPGPDTIIHDPHWHAPRILRAARAAIATATTMSEAEVLRAERDHARDISARSIAILSRIRSFLTPEDVRLPDGRVMQFNNPEIEREMLRGLCTAIRAIPGDLATGPAMSEAARDVLAERRRQIEQEGWTLKHDDEHDGGQLPMAAASYAVAASYASAGLFPMPKGAPPTSWPWRKSWWKPTTPRRDLVKAGALILAEIERIDRKSAGGSDE